MWADMMCAYYPSERLLVSVRDGEAEAISTDFSILKNVLLSAKVDISEIKRYSSSSTQSMLDKLLDSGHITPSEYLRRIPNGLVPERDELIAAMIQREGSTSKKGATHDE